MVMEKWSSIGVILYIHNWCLCTVHLLSRSSTDISLFLSLMIPGQNTAFLAFGLPWWPVWIAFVTSFCSNFCMMILFPCKARPSFTTRFHLKFKNSHGPAIPLGLHHLHIEYTVVRGLVFDALVVDVMLDSFEKNWLRGVASALVLFLVPFDSVSATGILLCLLLVLHVVVESQAPHDYPFDSRWFVWDVLLGDVL